MISYLSGVGFWFASGGFVGVAGCIESIETRRNAGFFIGRRFPRPKSAALAFSTGAAGLADHRGLAGSRHGVNSNPASHHRSQRLPAVAPGPGLGFERRQFIADHRQAGRRLTLLVGIG